MSSTSTVSKAEFARLAGMSLAAISKATQDSLRAALSDGGINKDSGRSGLYVTPPSGWAAEQGQRGGSVRCPVGLSKPRMAQRRTT